MKMTKGMTYLELLLKNRSDGNVTGDNWTKYRASCQ